MVNSSHGNIHSFVRLVRSTTIDAMIKSTTVVNTCSMQVRESFIRLICSTTVDATINIEHDINTMNASWYPRWNITYTQSKKNAHSRVCTSQLHRHYCRRHHQ